MEFLYTKTGTGIRVDKVQNPSAIVVIPEELGGAAVTELGAYVLADTGVEELHIPSGVERIGAYAFYNCECLKRLFCHSRIRDLGTGMFAGAKGPEFLDFMQADGEVSYLKDMLAELRQTLRVQLHGAGEARLIFPEYFEESVENTPARILFIETHGCGHRYRYCFRQREFQYREYDELFPHIRVQEQEALVTELALGRTLYPCGLTLEHKEMYRAYLKEHWEMAGKLIIETDCKSGQGSTNLDKGLMPWFAEHYTDSAPQVQVLTELAQRSHDTEAVSWLMDWHYERYGINRKKRRFEL